MAHLAVATHVMISWELESFDELSCPMNKRLDSGCSSSAAFRTEDWSFYWNLIVDLLHGMTDN